MQRSITHTILAAFTVVAFTACSGSGAGPGSPSNPFPTGAPPQTSGAKVLNTIVGIGDSLTAGEESDGLVGQTVPNPLFPATSIQPQIHATQTFGWWADMFNAVYGANAANARLPLIKAPGIGTFLVIATAGGFTSFQTSCTGLNAFAFGTASAALTATRVSPSSIPWDLGVPGQMVHEALYQTGPQGPCQAVSVAPGSLFGAETTNFWPVLGNFNGLSQVQAARSLSPTLTTVWLGANDLLKYAVSGGQFGPTPVSSIQSDLTTIVQTMQQAGSQVAIANLPDVLKTPLFIPITNVPAQATDPLPVTIVTLSGLPIGNALTIANGVIGANNLTVGAYILFNAMPAILAVATGGAIPNNLVAQGEALTATTAASVQSLNTSYNTAIQTVATNNGAAFVDIHALFVQAALPGGVPVNPGICCTLTPFGGLTSWDMLHPSYTGYALIANAWISAINTKFSTAIPQVNVQTQYLQDPYAPGSPVFMMDYVRHYYNPNNHPSF